MSILQTGSKGPEVANWQRFLITQGYEITPDGDFGPSTHQATVDFQSANHLGADGKVGPATLAKAHELPAPVIHASVATATMPSQQSHDPNYARLMKVHPNLAAKVTNLIGLARVEGFNLQVSQGLRTFAEQDALFLKRPKVTNARGGASYHNYGLAVDLVFVIDGKISWNDTYYRKIGAWAAEVGLEWGGNWRTFKDLPHVQIPNLPSYRELLTVYNRGGLPAVWEQFVK